MAIGEREIECAKKLFWEGWFSDDPWAPTKYMTPDVVMRDIVGHPEAIVGHEAVADFWKKAAGRMRLPVEEMFISENGICVQWFVYVRIDSGDNAGKWDMGEGVSRLEFRDGLVCLEVDYWHGRQGICDDWEAHWAARKALSHAERGAISGAWNPPS